MLYDIFNQGQVATFIVLIISAVAYFFLSQRVNAITSSGGTLPPLRRLPFLDALEDSIGRATETGRPIAYFTIQIDSVGVALAVAMIGLQSMFETARICARTGTRLLVYPTAEAAINISRQYLLDAYSAEGKMDELDEDTQFIWIQGRNCGSKDIRQIHSFWEENIAAAVYFGMGSCNSQQTGANAPVIGATALLTGERATGVTFAASWGDYGLYGQETLAFGAYLTGDPIQVSGVYTMDFMNIIFLGLVSVGFLLISMGNSIVKDFILL